MAHCSKLTRRLVTTLTSMAPTNGERRVRSTALAGTTLVVTMTPTAPLPNGAILPTVPSFVLPTVRLAFGRTGHRPLRFRRRSWLRWMRTATSTGTSAATIRCSGTSSTEVHLTGRGLFKARRSCCSPVVANDGRRFRCRASCRRGRESGRPGFKRGRAVLAAK